jgi:CheY-like chemotaxis protein
VTDTGIGMDKDTLAGLFAKFSQADASMTRRFGGTGLGLAISQELALLMGGEVLVSSQVGAGSTFTLSLPLQRIGEGLEPAAPLAEPRASRPLNLRVLAAEDNPVNQMVLRTLLSQIGIEPVVVENGALAVEAVTAQSWDLILMDVQMPIMDGMTATRTIRALEAHGGMRRTPIYALTANAMAHQGPIYVEAGMDGCLAKPIETTRLFEVLAAAMDLADRRSIRSA